MSLARVRFTPQLLCDGHSLPFYKYNKYFFLDETKINTIYDKSSPHKIPFDIRDRYKLPLFF